MNLLRPLTFFAVIAVACAAVTPLSSAQAPYRILITNDDGVRAPGLLAVVQALQPMGEITIVAPADNQSGKGHSISITDPVYVDPVTLPGGIEALGATATPASCVKLALLSLMKERPNLVVSGINRGVNLGTTTYVSGTVGAAREAAMHAVPAIASSLDTSSGFSDYTAAARATAEIAAMIKAQGLASGVFLNVNVPAGAPKGTRVATQSKLSGDETWIEQKNPRGRRYFWNDYHESTSDTDPASDVSIMAQGYVAVVPLRAIEYDARAAETLKKTIK